MTGRQNDGARSPAVLVLVFLGGQHAAAQVGETVLIPMKDHGLFGERLIRLEATLFKPQGDGPFINLDLEK